MLNLVNIHLIQSIISASNPRASKIIPIGVDFLSPICSILLVSLLRKLRKRSDAWTNVAMVI